MRVRHARQRCLVMICYNRIPLFSRSTIFGKDLTHRLRDPTPCLQRRVHPTLESNFCRTLHGGYKTNNGHIIAHVTRSPPARPHLVDNGRGGAAAVAAATAKRTCVTRSGARLSEQTALSDSPNIARAESRTSSGRKRHQCSRFVLKFHD